MARRVTAFDVVGIELNRSSSTALHRQLYASLRSVVLQRRLAAGTRLPSSRFLARELRVSRLTILSAIDQLVAEGYLEARRGSGTFVADVLLLRGADFPRSVRMPASVEPTTAISHRAKSLTSLSHLQRGPSSDPPHAFRLGGTALDAFPHREWMRALRVVCRTLPSEALGYGDPFGYLPLRRAIAAYLGQARGVECTADQVLIVSSTQQAIDLSIRVLANPRESIWLEDPGYGGARGAAAAGGCDIVPVPVDEQGFCFTSGPLDRPPRLVYITPSHQFPLGMTMTLARRLALVEWARATGATILEDDSSSEFRHTGEPLVALQGLDHNGCVLYIGTFNKILFPALRLAYLVVPTQTIEAFRLTRGFADGHSPIIEQAAVTSFIEEGHFARHISRMRRAYGERQEALIALLHHKLAGAIEPQRAETGLHLVAWLPPDSDDTAIAERTKAYGVTTYALSSFRMAARTRSGLVLGFGGVAPSEMSGAVDRLAMALDASSVRQRRA
jgi:GntR family transcriptional regulator/MocR family aminotransferase